MKAVLVIYNEVIETEVAEVLERAGVGEFTKFPNVFGIGAGSGPRLGDNVWPGSNNALLVVAPKEKAQALIDGVQALRETMSDAGLRAFWWQIEGMM